MSFHILGTGVPSRLFNEYNSAAPTRTTLYDPSQFGWNFPSVGLAVFSKTLLKAMSLSWNVRGFIRLLYKFANLCWYDSIRITAALRSSSAISRSLATALALASSRIPNQSVGMSIFVGIIASLL